MNRRYIIIISIILLISIIVIMFWKFNNGKVNKNIDNAKETIKKDVVQYDEESGYYYIKNSETGEIRSASKNKEDLKIYIDNPNYDPDPLSSNPTDLQEYIMMNYETSSENTD